MKSMFLKYMSALMAVWYCMSIIGFDVHSCTETGNIFINSILSGTTCDEIHPEHDCGGHSGCCSHKPQPRKSHSCTCCNSHEIPAAESVGSDDNCCTDDIKVLDSEGVIAVNGGLDGHAVCLACSMADAHDSILPEVWTEVNPYCPDPGNVIEPDLQAMFNIWRI